jgi:hypothetical protein
VKEKTKVTRLISSKLATVILACIICILLTSRVYAEEVVIATGDCGGEGSSVTYTIYDTDGDSEADMLIISGEGEMCDYRDYAPWYDYRNSLKNAVIEEGVTSIGRHAFYECKSLTSVNILESVTSIGAGAFYGCSSLTSINIPEGVTSIARYAFYECKSLTAITIPEGVTSIGEYAFYGCYSLTSVNIPESVTSIDGYAFYECRSLTSISLPEGVTSIGSAAFAGSSLTSINIPESVTSIGRGAFSRCRSITNLIIPEGVTRIEASTFSDCSSLTNLSLPEGVTSIGEYAFYGCYNLKSVNVPEGITRIEDYTFFDCSSLPSITIPEGVTSIGEHAFYKCRSLTSISLPEGVTSIGKNAFYNCVSLESVNIPEGITGITYGVFYNCSSLTSISLPEGLTVIGAEAFYNCRSLTSISLPEGLTGIGAEAFYNCRSLTSISLPEGLTGIGAEAFYGCWGLTSINIPEGVRNIGEAAFASCSLTSVKIPESVKNISDRAFGYEYGYIEGDKDAYPYIMKYGYPKDGFGIMGYPNSAAETYAKENGFVFIDLSALKYDMDGHLTFYLENTSGWVTDSDGSVYWYENGYRVGYDAMDSSYRGKEIYDEDSDAWYWLDSISYGKKAVSKDVYQESDAGIFADNSVTGTGKWSRYDADGKMVKGWDENEKGRYYFDPVYGAMVKGYYTIGDTEYYFSELTGVASEVKTDGLSGYTGWKNISGADYWYEDGQRQGYRLDRQYRGKEIYDPVSDAWYWLDNISRGKKAVSKDVYQESQGDDEGNIGKWVRYDSEGHMIKGWSAGYGADARTITGPSEANDEAVYYFDLTYGTMAKGTVTIDGKEYSFDEVTGVLEK